MLRVDFEANMDKNCKEKIVESIVSNIHTNYNTVADALENEYDFIPLDSVRYEICLCIMCGLNQASITLTNHLLESSLKKFLILHDSIVRIAIPSEISLVFAKATETYSGKSLNDIIEDAYECGLIDNSERELLHDFRKVYRNPYSHANSKQIFSNRPFPLRVLHVDEIESVDDFYKIFESPNTEVNPQNFLPLQGILQVLKAENCSKEYFLKVDEIIRRINQRLHA